MPTDAQLEVRYSIQQLIGGLVQDGAKGQEAAVFDDAAIKTMGDAVDALLGTDDLMQAADAMFVIAHLLHTEQASPKAAQAIVSVLNRENVLASMKKLKEDKDRERAAGTEKSARDFAKFADQSGDTAPTTDDEAPKDSLKLDSLNFPKRL